MSRLSREELLKLQQREADLCLDIEGYGNRLGELEVEKTTLIGHVDRARTERNGLRIVLKAYGVPAMGVDTEDENAEAV